MDGDSKAVSEAILQNIARHVNCLGEGNRMVKKKAIEGIRKEIFGTKTETDKSVLKLLFNELAKPLLKLLSDPVEKCRELSTSIIREFVCSVPNPGDYLHLIIPVLVQRLGQQDIVEPSEEVRFQLVQLLLILAGLPSEEIAPYLNDFVIILQRTLIDQYAEVKKESCHCASAVAKSVPQHFHMQSESLIKPLLTSMSHQHSRVRVEVVTALGDVIQYGNGKSVDDVVSHLAQRLFDGVPSVRTAVTQVLGNWLLDLPDRYSFHHKLIPLLLTCMADELPDIRSLASDLWHDVGLKYEGENENDLKDQQDFVKADPKHYPPGVERPNLGCRTLVYRNFSKVLSGLSRDITDWVVGTRIKSAQLLYMMLINEEENVTQHLDKVLGALYKACNDEEPLVQEYVSKSAELIGYFVPEEIWVKLVLDNVRLSQSTGALRVLSVVRGCERASLVPYLTEICDTLAQHDICRMAETGVQVELLNVVASLVQVCGDDVRCVSLQLFTILISVAALHRNMELLVKADQLLAELAEVQGLEGGTSALYEAHALQVLGGMREPYTEWTIHSTDRLIFDTLIINAEGVVGRLIDDIVPVFRVNLSPDKDPVLKLKFFSLLSKLLVALPDTLDSANKFQDFAVELIKDVILPNCVWRAGRVASAVRTVAMSCLWAVLQSHSLTADMLLPVLDDITTQLRSCMDDDTTSTRLLSCRALTHLFTVLGTSLDSHRLHNMYPDLLRRLDDSSDDVRVAVTKTLLAYFDCFEAGYEVDLYRAHIEAVYKGLLIHLDDPDAAIQTAVLEVLQKASSIEPRLLMREIDTVKHKHRSTRYCDQLEQYVRSMNIEEKAADKSKGDTKTKITDQKQPGNNHTASVNGEKEDVQS